MKKIGTLNSHLSLVIAKMGHSDKLIICDSGLPIPRSAEVIDLALTKNIPTFIDTVSVILEELQVESVIIANEIETVNKKRYHELIAVLQKSNIHQIQKVSHEEFKNISMNGGNIAFVRTGEATPYANVILIAGVAFD
jgi:D-ribose pyranase